MTRDDKVRALVSERMASADALAEAFREETSTESGREMFADLIATALTCHPDDVEMHAMRLRHKLEDALRYRITSDAEDETPEDEENDE